MFELGNWYVFKPHDGGKISCVTCGADVFYVCYGRLMIYQGVQEGVHIFKYVEPFLCPGCNKFFEYNQEFGGTLDVTQEFLKLMEKK